MYSWCLGALVVKSISNMDPKYNYISHILLWMLPVIAIQWALAWRIFRRNLRAVFIPPLVIGTFYSLADSVAVRDGIWYFDPAQNMGMFVGPLPIEEIIFFYTTALLVSQSFVMLVPERFREKI
jgi:lycopene cyclase domain-containing protein